MTTWHQVTRFVRHEAGHLTDLTAMLIIVAVCQVALIVSKLYNPELMTWWIALLPLEVGVVLYLLCCVVIWVVTRDIRKDGKQEVQ